MTKTDWKTPHRNLLGEIMAPGHEFTPLWSHRNPVRAWFCAHQSNTLTFDDDRPIHTGGIHTCDPARIKPGLYGLHATRQLITCLWAAMGTYLYRVEVSGIVCEGTYEITATRRKYLWGPLDITPTILRLARRCALEAFTHWDHRPAAIEEFLCSGDVILIDAALSEINQDILPPSVLTLIENRFLCPSGDLEPCQPKDPREGVAWAHQLAVLACLRAFQTNRWLLPGSNIPARWTAVSADALQSAVSTGTERPRKAFFTKRFDLNAEFESEVWATAESLGLTDDERLHPC